MVDVHINNPVDMLMIWESEKCIGSGKKHWLNEQWRQTKIGEHTAGCSGRFYNEVCGKYTRIERLANNRWWIDNGRNNLPPSTDIIFGTMYNLSKN